MKGNEIFDRLSMSFDLPSESLPGQSVLEMIDNSRLIVENHCGLIKYTTNDICVRVKFGNIVVRGAKLRIVKMTDHTIVICGCIESVEMQRRR